MIYKSIFFLSPAMRDLGNLVNLLFRCAVFFSPAMRDLGNLINLIFPLRGLLFSPAARDL